MRYANGREWTCDVCGVEGKSGQFGRPDGWIPTRHGNVATEICSACAQVLDSDLQKARTGIVKAYVDGCAIMMKRAKTFEAKSTTEASVASVVAGLLNQAIEVVLESLHASRQHPSLTVKVPDPAAVDDDRLAEEVGNLAGDEFHRRLFGPV